MHRDKHIIFQRGGIYSYCILSEMISYESWILFGQLTNKILYYKLRFGGCQLLIQWTVRDGVCEASLQLDSSQLCRYIYKQTSLQERGYSYVPIGVFLLPRIIGLSVLQLLFKIDGTIYSMKSFHISAEHRNVMPIKSNFYFSVIEWYNKC